MTVRVHANTSLQHVCKFAYRLTARDSNGSIGLHMLAKRKPPVIKPGGAENMRYKTPPLWLSFSTAHRRDYVPATLSEALFRLHLVYPLASFDVSGQWPVYLAAAWPNEDYSSCTTFIHPPNNACQEVFKDL